MGSVASECVGKAVEHHAQVSLDAIGPVVFEVLTILVLEAHRCQSARRSVHIALKLFARNARNTHDPEKLSKPVANTITSNSNFVPSLNSKPFSLNFLNGVAFRSTMSTFS